MTIDKAERHKGFCLFLNDIYKKKNHDYNDSFHKTFVEEGMAMPRIRLGDKFERFKNLTKNPNSQQVNDESIRDTLLDLANYAIMTVLEMDLVEKEGFSSLPATDANPPMPMKTTRVPGQTVAWKK